MSTQINPLGYLGQPLTVALQYMAVMGQVDCPLPDDPSDPARRRYASIWSEGISLVIENEVVVAVQLFGEEREGFSPWRSTLEDGLKFTMDRPQVQAVLGSPERSWDPFILPILGAQPPADAFTLADHRVLVTYANDQAEGIRLISLTRN